MAGAEVWDFAIRDIGLTVVHPATSRNAEAKNVKQHGTKQDVEYAKNRFLQYNFKLTYYSIVFVHGIIGHPERTWSASAAGEHDSDIGDVVAPNTTPEVSNSGLKNSTFWPGALLPQILPNS